MKFCQADNCDNPVFGKGFCRNHQYKRADFDKRSIIQRGIDKHKEKKRSKGWFDTDAIDNDELEAIVGATKGGSEQWRWFQEQRSKMVGICAHCGGKTQRHDNDNFHYSIAHILPKSIFKSIATHDENWIELCYYGNSCHANYDRNMIAISDLNCFDTVIEKIVKMYPFIAKEERRRIPTILMEYIKQDL